MESKGIRIEHYGHLSKAEKVTTLSSNIVPGTLVLEAPEPFPGSLSYYSEAPHLSKPLYIYVVLDGFPGLELVASATDKVHKKTPFEFSAAYANIEVNFEQLDTIRIRHLMSFDQIEIVQHAYMEEHLQMKKSIHKLEGNARIELKKLFQLISYPNNLYLDFDEKDHGYITIPEKLKEDEFETMIRRVKNNTFLYNYDFAQAFFYTSNKIIRLLRVYYPEMNIQLLSQVKEAVYARLKRQTISV